MSNPNIPPVSPQAKALVYALLTEWFKEVTTELPHMVRDAGRPYGLLDDELGAIAVVSYSHIHGRTFALIEQTIGKKVPLPPPQELKEIAAKQGYDIPSIPHGA